MKAVDDQQVGAAREGEVIPLPRRESANASKVVNSLLRLKFARAYIETNGNGVEAARRAGYRGDAASLGVIACNLLKRDDIKSYLSEMLRAILSAEEASAILSDIARGSLGYFLAREEDGRLKRNEHGAYELDLDSEEAQANLHIIKKLKPTRYGVEIELVSKTEALAIFARCLEIKTSDLVQKLQVQAVIDSLPDEVRESVRALIASAEARRVDDEALLELPE